jgi:HK97 family phage prohead protease
VPWDVRKGFGRCGADEYAVVKSDTDEVVACHAMREGADRQFAALYANEPAAGRTEMSEMTEDQGDRFGSPHLFVRSYPLEDIRILTRAQGSEYANGRTVEAYAAVFDREAEIQDHEGHYKEIIDRTSFNRAIEHSRPQGGRTTWRTGVFYNHGMTLFGTPSDRFSVPLGSPVDVKATDHGLLTITRYSESPLADEILEAIRSGAITGHSFTGRIIRSDPQRPPSRRGYARRGDGSLVTVRRLEMGLREYGPTPFPAYADAAVVGIRNVLAGLSLPALLSATREVAERELVESGVDPDEAARTATDDPEDSDTSTRVETVTEDPPPDEGHSSRDALLRRIAAAKTSRPGLARDPDAEARRARVGAITRPEGNSG